jgi:Family of unknown function (DUF5996)
MDRAADACPDLDVPGWQATASSLHLWSQIVGKTRLALADMMNHWWQVPLYVSARGLATSPIPQGGRAFDVELDLVEHRLIVRASDGGVETMELGECALASFYQRYMQRLAALGFQVSIYPVTVELPERVQLDRDTRPCAYDREWANRFYRALLSADAVLKRFRGHFLGKASPVHVFWGALDLAVTRFSGRRAPPHPGGVPNVGDWVMREAYSHEVSSAGFWAGDARFPQAAFYAYAYPEPAGFKDAAVRPAAARYEPSLGEFVLPYAAVRAARDPAADLFDFLQTTYVAAADLARWDRAALERQGDVR